ncbi:MAG: TIGR04211 family SH3 domain-containing protein [Proteobacteria bacterium]|nr:TIGR04211 family SH3 domain-containing protein [Pseudomonadota bacterium]MBU1231821.1 TIGR04211 family SH3 domain-containing protein [Pseudomonadota bacterium]MBU1419984.1 TIGR04211 family SH3 domain-containing protein [Pseudomonadota bacterium]MBU1454767.1 TIGR04211 family SH3 domain-containing protein [Pseudomonadota bacterium]
MIIRQIKISSGSLSVFFLTPTLLLTFSTLLFWQTPVFAKALYVKPSSEVVVRRGQGNEYKIIAMVNDGASVEFLEEDESYAKVRLADGKEGWMLKRFLSEDPPLEEVVTALRTEKEEMKQKTNELMQKLEEVSSTLARTETERDSILTERNQLMTQHHALQRDTANVVQTKTDLVKTAKENALLVTELNAVKQENNSLKKNNAIKWFLAGGGVLLIGILFGKVSGQSRRKKSLL